MNMSNVLTAKQVQVKSILRSTYSYMASGLLITALVSWVTVTSPTLRQLIFRPGVMMVSIIAELVLVFYLSARIMRMPASRASLIFYTYSALNGFVLSSVFFIYTRTSIFQAFLTAAGAFAGMSIYAMTTKKDLTGMGKYLIMGLWGLIISSLLSMFFPGAGLAQSPIFNLIALLLFLGLTAYDTQIILGWSREYGDTIPNEDFRRLSVIGALKLYLDFVNLFLILLRFMGRRE